MSKKAQTPVTATKAPEVHSACDALIAISDFLSEQIAEARPHFEAQDFGTVEFNEEQAFIKTLNAAAAILSHVISGKPGIDLIDFHARVVREYRLACRATSEADRLACDDISVTEQREAQARSAAWAMVYHFTNRQYRRANAA